MYMQCVFQCICIYTSVWLWLYSIASYECMCVFVSVCMRSCVCVHVCVYSTNFSACTVRWRCARKRHETSVLTHWPVCSCVNIVLYVRCHERPWEHARGTRCCVYVGIYTCIYYILYILRILKCMQNNGSSLWPTIEVPKCSPSVENWQPDIRI